MSHHNRHHTCSKHRKHRKNSYDFNDSCDDNNDHHKDKRGPRGPRGKRGYRGHSGRDCEDCIRELVVESIDPNNMNVTSSAVIGPFPDNNLQFISDKLGVYR